MLLLIAHRSAFGQVPFEITLHLYKPIQKNREVMMDSMLTFYAPYKVGEETYFPVVYFKRNDLSHLRYKLVFRVFSGEEFKEVDEEYIRAQKTQILVKSLSNKKNRMHSGWESEVYDKKGLRRYDCDFEDNPSRKTFHLFLGSKSDSQTNHFTKIKNLKKKISSILKDYPGALINIHFSDQDKLCNGDEIYVNHSIKHLNYSRGNTYTSLGEMEALTIVRQNRNAILEKIQSNAYKDILFEDGSIIFQRSYGSEHGVGFEIKWKGLCKDSITGEYKNKDGFSNIASFDIRIELDKYGNYSSCLLLNSWLPNWYLPKKKIVTEPVNDQFPVIEETEVFDAIESFAQVEPLYPGGEQALLKEIYSKIHYPSKYLKDKIEGTVYISFVVEKSGEITSISVDRGIPDAPEFSEQAENAIKQLKKRFYPAKRDGKYVRYQYRLPIKFSLK